METTKYQDALSVESEEVNPGMVVLQPYGDISAQVGVNFQKTLSQAIDQAEAVIVDLLWVDAVDEQGISVLLEGMRQAQALGKSLSFLAMDAATRNAIDTVWEQQRMTNLPVRLSLFTPDFEQFLDNHKEAKLSAS